MQFAIRNHFRTQKGKTQVPLRIKVLARPRKSIPMIFKPNCSIMLTRRPLLSALRQICPQKPSFPLFSRKQTTSSNIYSRECPPTPVFPHFSKRAHSSAAKYQVHVTSVVRKQMYTGHPWIYSKGVKSVTPLLQQTTLSHASKQATPSHASTPRSESGETTSSSTPTSSETRESKSGDVVDIIANNGDFLGNGLIDPISPVKVRVFSFKEPCLFDLPYFVSVVERAFKLRESLLESTTGFRAINGESDRLPGIIVDKYDSVLVVKLYSEIWYPHLDTFLNALETVFSPRAIVLRQARNVASDTSGHFANKAVVRGHLDSPEVVFKENGLLFSTNVIEGHKTGFFFDQRENRQLVGQLAKNRSVLDLFTYSGGFSVYCAAGGASRVASVDISKPAVQAARKNMQLNSSLAAVKACKFRTQLADLFSKKVNLQVLFPKKFDFIVVDPPSLANKASQVQQATATYRQLVKNVIPLLEDQPGSLLFFSSCSTRIYPADFFKIVLTEAGKYRRFRVINRTLHTLDHPVLSSFPEGQYLKALFLEQT